MLAVILARVLVEFPVKHLDNRGLVRQAKFAILLLEPARQPVQAERLLLAAICQVLTEIKYAVRRAMDIVN